MKITSFEINLTEDQQRKIEAVWATNGTIGCAMLGQPKTTASGGYGKIRLALFTPDSAERIATVLEQESP